MNLAGVYDIHTNMMQYPVTMQPTHIKVEQVRDSTVDTGSSRFPPMDAKIPRNFKVIDTYMESPPAGVSPAAMEQREVPSFLAEFQGLGAVSDDIKDLLPSECRTAFDKALKEENEWKAKWGSESENTHRRPPIIDASIVPYSKNV